MFSTMVRGNMALATNDLAEAKRRLAQYQATAERYKIGLDMRRTLLWRAEHARLDGDFEGADRLLAQEIETPAIQFQELTDIDLAGGNIHLMLLRAQEGRLAEIELGIRDSSGLLPLTRLPRRALVSALLGRLGECRAALDEMMTVPLDELSAHPVFSFSAASMSEACMALSDRASAERLYPWLLPSAGYNLVTRAGDPIFFGPVDRYLGGLAALCERWDDAERHFEDALRMTAALPSPPYLAQTQYDYARMLIARDEAGDRQRALTLLADAGETARRIGMKMLLDDVLALRIAAQGLSSTDVMTSISAVALKAERDYTDLRPLAAPDGSVTIMFSDIEGSTEINERLGDSEWMALLRAHNAMVRDELKAHSGHEVKTAGDGFMVSFQSPIRAVECAIAIQRAFAAHNERHTEHPLRVRIGLHTGTPVAEGGDYYGKDVTLAFRIADSAQGGDIIVSGRLRDLVREEAGLSFAEAREVELKGLRGSSLIYAVNWTSS